MAKSSDPTADEIIHHRMIVGSNIKNKLQEYAYFLRQIINICHDNYDRFLNKTTPVNTGQNNINFTFNAFINTFQSLKDSLSTATGIEINWANFDKVKHARFIKACRNATTHDGQEIINAWSDGKYYIAGKLERIEINRGQGRLIIIEPPIEDLKTLCIEFSMGLMSAITEIINHHGENIPVSSAKNRFEYAEEFVLGSHAVPDDIKHFIRENKDFLISQIDVIKFDPIGEIKQQILEIEGICTQAC